MPQNTKCSVLLQYPLSPFPGRIVKLLFHNFLNRIPSPFSFNHPTFLEKRSIKNPPYTFFLFPRVFFFGKKKRLNQIHITSSFESTAEIISLSRRCLPNDIAFVVFPENMDFISLY